MTILDSILLDNPYTHIMGSVVLPHLVTGWHVDQAILSEERLVVIRFSRDWDPDCMRQDEVLYRMCYLLPFALPEFTKRLQVSPIV